MEMRRLGTSAKRAAASPGVSVHAWCVTRLGSLRLTADVGDAASRNADYTDLDRTLPGHKWGVSYYRDGSVSHEG